MVSKTIFKKYQPKSFLYYDLDSLRTHPETEFRYKLIGEITQNMDLKAPLHSRVFEYVSGRYKRLYLQKCEELKRDDLALHMALIYKRSFPNNDWVNLLINDILIRLSLIQGTAEFAERVIMNTNYYGEELQLVNAFLYNTTKMQKLTIAYNFLNSTNNFNPDLPEYYRTLYNYLLPR